MMSHRVATLTRRLAALASMLLLLTACGGGGGGGGGGFLSGSGDNVSYSLELEVVDAAGNATSSVTATRPATLRVRVTDGGNAARDVVVQASAEFVVISPENGQALTGTDGVATFELRAGDSLGADTITVSVDCPSGTVTATIGVQVELTDFSLGFFDGNTFVNGQIGISAENLAYGGSAVLRVAIVDENGQTAPVAEQIRFRSQCAQSGRARLRAPGDSGDGSASLVIESVEGLASVEYLAGTCEGEDEITAELVDGNASATGTITVAERTADFIGLYSASPSEGEDGADRTIIALRGTGGPGRPEVARLTFEVLESAVNLAPGDPGPGEAGYLSNPARAPLAGVEVQFTLTNTVGGITLLNESAVSDANGLASVEVRAGNVATSTRVVASFNTTGVDGNTRPQEATSNQIVVSTC